MTDINVDTEMVSVMEPVVASVVADVDVKKQARLEQLAQARQSAKDKKSKEKDQLSTMSSKLDALTAALLAKEENKAPIAEKEAEIKEEPGAAQLERPKKRVRVTVEDEEDTVPESTNKGDSFLVNACRTGLVLGLAATSYYVQNVWKKTEAKPSSREAESATKKRRLFQTQAPPQNGVLHAKTPIGRSGFVM